MAPAAQHPYRLIAHISDIALNICIGAQEGPALGFDLCRLRCTRPTLFPQSKESEMGLKGSKTEQNLKDAFAGESQANRRYLYFANKADIEGQNDVAALFRSTAEGETGHAHGHLEFLEAVGDPATGLPIGATRDNLKSAVAGETHEYTDMYPGMAKQAREEGFDEIADWFETLAKAERSHANRYQKALDVLLD
jgi:rubrerythrin